jgi:flagellar motor switch protein FliN/FliY
VTVVDNALLKLANQSAEAVEAVLHGFCADGVVRGVVGLAPAGMPPLDAIALPPGGTSVSYGEAVTGGNIFSMTRLGARKLAAAMMGQDPVELEDDAELSELELSAVGEAMNQMMATAAGATSKLLGEEVAISPPQTTFYSTQAEAEGAHESTPHMATASFTVLGEPCRLIQLVPNAFIVRIARALDDLEAEVLHNGHNGGVAMLSPTSIRGIPVRVSAELGRVRMPVGRAVRLANGSVVELDRAADDPVDLYVNGRPFGRGVLVLTDGGEWAIRIDELLLKSAPIQVQAAQAA